MGDQMATNLDKQKAAYEKEKGNAAFKDGKFKEAFELYTKGIEYDISQPILYCNRAMALLKLNRYFEAKIDCDQALRLDSTYVKAYFRRGLASASFNDVDSALSDFDKVLSFEPQNKEALKEKDKLLQLLAKNPDKLRQVLPVDKPKHLTAQNLCRIDIKDANLVSSNETVKTVSDKKQDKIFVQDEPIPTSASLLSVALAVPKTAFHFLTGWRSIKDDPKRFCTYVLQIPTESYPNVVDGCLEPVLITDILNAFAKYGEKRKDKLKIFLCLKTITELKNFKTCKLFLDDKDSSNLNVIFDYLIASDLNLNENEIGDVKKLYAI